MSESTITFNPDNWTVGDLDDFERITGLTLEEAFRPASVKDASGDYEKDTRGRPVKALRLGAKVMLAIVFIEKRGIDPDFTEDDARKVRFTDLTLDGGGGDADPEAPSAETDESGDSSN